MYLLKLINLMKGGHLRNKEKHNKTKFFKFRFSRLYLKNKHAVSNKKIMFYVKNKKLIKSKKTVNIKKVLTEKRTIHARKFKNFVYNKIKKALKKKNWLKKLVLFKIIN